MRRTWIARERVRLKWIHSEGQFDRREEGVSERKRDFFCCAHTRTCSREHICQWMIWINVVLLIFGLSYLSKIQIHAHAWRARSIWIWGFLICVKLHSFFDWRLFRFWSFTCYMYIRRNWLPPTRGKFFDFFFSFVFCLQQSHVCLYDANCNASFNLEYHIFLYSSLLLICFPNNWTE